MKSYDSCVRVCAAMVVLSLMMLTLELDEKSGLYLYHTKDEVVIDALQTEEAVANDKEERNIKTGQEESTGNRADGEGKREEKKIEPADHAGQMTVTRTFDRDCGTYHMSQPVIEQECLIRQRVVADESERDILYRIVQAEAGGEDALGKKMVADVVMNRVQSEKFPDSISEVVFQRSGGKVQFSPTKDGRLGRVKVTQETKDAVDEAMLEEDHTDGALYFVATSKAAQDKVSWFERALTNKGTHGGHTFYR